MAERKLTVVLAGDSRGLDRAMRSANTSVSTFGSRVGRVAKTAAIGLAGLGVAGFALGKSFVDAATESMKVSKQTEAVLESMGSGANVTAKQVANLSEALAAKAGIDDELIQSGSNLLLTFKSLRNETGKGNKIFDRATEAALNMSVALGTDMKSASIAVGKALNDPIAGLTSLRRMGIQFTDQQKEQIKTMVAVGDTAGAQKVILGELERQFGGSAEAQATAADKLKVAWGNVQEQLGEKLLPILNSVAEWLSARLPGAMATLSAWVDTTLKPALDSAKAAFEENVLPAMRKVGSFIVDTLVPNLGKIASWIVKNKPVLLGLATVVGVTLVGAFLAWAGAAIVAAAATLAATWPVLLLIGVTGALTAATVWAIQKFSFLQKALNSIVGVALLAAKVGLPALIGVIRALAGFLSNAADAAARLIGLLGRIPNLSLTATRGLDSAIAQKRKLEGKRAIGGPVSAGGAYLVGERGPELLQMGKTSGRIIPNHAMGGSSINVYVAGSVLSDRDLVATINRATRKGIA